jgi:hypothetical protein
MQQDAGAGTRPRPDLATREQCRKPITFLSGQIHDVLLCGHGDLL